MQDERALRLEKGDGGIGSDGQMDRQTEGKRNRYLQHLPSRKEAGIFYPACSRNVAISGLYGNDPYKPNGTEIAREVGREGLPKVARSARPSSMSGQWRCSW